MEIWRFLKGWSIVREIAFDDAHDEINGGGFVLIPSLLAHFHDMRDASEDVRGIDRDQVFQHLQDVVRDARYGEIGEIIQDRAGLAQESAFDIEGRR